MKSRFPILLACAPTGKLYVRWFVDRELLKPLAEASAGDDVVFQDTDELLIEISAHDSAEAAQREADKIKAAVTAMLSGVRGAA